MITALTNIKQKISTGYSSITFTAKNKKSLNFLLYSFPFTYLLLIAFAFKASMPDSLSSLFYVISIPAFYFIVISLVTYLLSKLLFTSKLLWLLVIPKVLLDVFLVADLFVFDVYRFHIDMLFIKMLIFDFSGIGISLKLTIFSLTVISIIVATNMVIFKLHNKLPILTFRKWQIGIIIFFIVGQMFHVVGYEYKNESYTRYTPYLPYYSPLTSSLIMIQLKKIAPETFPQKSEATQEYVDLLLKNNSKGGSLNYPLAKMQCDINADGKENVLLFVIESWRFDQINASTSPNIYKLAKQSSQYTNHYSGGSVTVNGLFSLMHGLHPSYREYMSASPYQNQSILTKTLASQGYDVSAYTSSWLDRFSLKAMLFGKIEDDQYINPREERSNINDRNVVDRLVTDLQQEKQTPWFKFTFLTSSHHPYRYPDEFSIFKPINEDPEAFLFDKYTDRTPIVNDFKNSIKYIDTLFGEVLASMSQQQLDETMIIVTSDHGEEFNDNNLGYWGHGSNFTKYQAKVPMIVKMPKQNVAKIIDKRTAHIDIAPSILTNIAGCTNPIDEYSNGIDIFSEKNISTTRPIIISSYKNKAYLIEDKIYETMMGVDSYDVNDLNLQNYDYNYAEIQKLKQQETMFMR